MKKILLTFLLATGASAHAQFEIIPDSPLDTSMGDAAGNTIGTLNQVEQKEEEREEELLENRYDVPSEEEEKEFNQNGTNEP